MKVLEYKKGYKYQTHKVFTHNVGSFEFSNPNGTSVVDDFIELTKAGKLTIKAGYAWDGCSGPTIDTANTMQAGLVHDALYQLMRKNLIPASERLKADNQLREVGIANGMWKFKANIYHWAVNKFAKKAALPSHQKIIKRAP